MSSHPSTGPQTGHFPLASIRSRLDRNDRHQRRIWRGVDPVTAPTVSSRDHPVLDLLRPPVRPESAWRRPTVLNNHPDLIGDLTFKDTNVVDIRLTPLSEDPRLLDRGFAALQQTYGASAR